MRTVKSGDSRNLNTPLQRFLPSGRKMRVQSKNKSGGVPTALRENSKPSQPHFRRAEIASGESRRLHQPLITNH
jgi:hypothetical protein